MNINNDKESHGIVNNRKKIFERNEINNVNNEYKTKDKTNPNKLSKKRISYFENYSTETTDPSQKPIPAKLDPSKINFQNESSSVKNEVHTYAPIKRTPYFENPSNKTVEPSPAKLIQNSEISEVYKEKQAKFQTWLKSTNLNEIIKKITLEMYANKKTTLDKISLYYTNVPQEKLSSVELDKLNQLRNKYPRLTLPNIEDTISKRNQYVIDLIEKSSNPQVVLDEIGKHVSADHGYYIGDTSLLKHLTSHYNNKEQLTDVVTQNLLAIRKNFPEFKLNDTINSALDLENLSIPSLGNNDKLPTMDTNKIVDDPIKLVAAPISITPKTMSHTHFSIKGTFKKYLLHNKLTAFINKLVLKSFNLAKRTQMYIHTNNKNTKKHTKDNTKTLSK